MDIPSIITKKLLKAAMKHIEVIVKASQKGNTISCSEVWGILFLYANFHPKYLSTNKLSDTFINAVRVFVSTEILFSNLLIIQVVVWTQESMKIKVESLIVRYIIDELCLFFFFWMDPLPPSLLPLWYLSHVFSPFSLMISTVLT